MNRYVCIHGHFYQPPRENPWLEGVELQDSAYPYHDWNERITAECYAPNTASRILDHETKIMNIVNNYTKISFNIGPTLLSWMERQKPEVYQAIIEADGESKKTFSGHGSAMAQVYNHMIMPLANTRDKHTQVIWGTEDFEYRFGRKPEGMWLSETAIDLETLDIMAEHGIRFAIIAQHQARRARKIGDIKWKDVSGGKIDPKQPYLCRLSSGRNIHLFFYDGPISQDVAFGDLLNNGEVFAKRLLSAFSQDHDQAQLVHIATDGESYGHHYRFGDMALAYALHYLESNNLAKLTNYGEFLEKQIPTCEVEIIENTSWSCAHGIERWRSDCGCKTGPYPVWTQAWRAPLREAMDWLRDSLVPLYEREITPYLRDPWHARDDYIGVILDKSIQNVERFLSKHAVRELSNDEKIRVLKLLEMQRNAMLMYTSCGWFFNEISGIETVQVMQYAGRAMQLAKDVSGVSLEPHYIEILERAQSNIPYYNTGAQVYELFVKPCAIDLLRVAAHYAVSSLFEDYSETIKLYSYIARSEIYEREELGMRRLAIGKARVRSDITWEESVISFGVLHLGDHNLNGGVREYAGDDSFSVMRQETIDAFMRNDIPDVIRLMDKHFGTHTYSLWHLFRDEQRKVLEQILDSTLQEIEASFRQIYEHHYPIMLVMNEMRIPLPKPLATAVQYILNGDLRRLLEREELDFERLQEIVEEVKRWPFEFDKTTLGFIASQKMNALIEELSKTPEEVSLLETLEALSRIVSQLSLELDLWRAQNIYFSIGKQLSGRMRERADTKDQIAKKWIDLFDSVGQYLHVRVM